MKQEKRLIAIDDGYDETKIYSKTIGGRKIRSLFSLQPTDVADLGLSREAREGVYRIEGKTYAVGNVRHPENTRFDDYPYSPGNLAVAVHAMREAGVTGEVDVVTGMPVNRYYTNEGDARRDVVQRKRKSWMREIEGLDAHGRVLPESEMPRIGRVNVVSEAVAAWFDYCVDDEGVVLESRLKEQVAVVDIGGRTTDVAVIEDASVLMAHSGTTDHGALDIHAAIDRRIQGQLGLTRPVPRQRIAEGMESGIVRVGANDVDIRAMRSEEKRLLVERIKLFVSSLIGSEAAFIHRVIFVGGGAAMLREELQGMYPQMEVADEAQYANARGMFKYGLVAQSALEAA